MLNNHKEIFIGIFIGAILGLGGGYSYMQFNVDKNNTYEAGYNAAREKVKKSDMYPMMHTQTKSISGTVKEINGNNILLEAQILNPLADEKLKTRVVSINNDTKITLNKQRDMKEFANLMKDFQEKLNKGSKDNKNLVAPIPFVQSEGHISDIKVGSMIVVTSLNDIEESETFVASEIMLPIMAS